MHSATLFFMDNMASGMDRGRVRPTTTKNDDDGHNLALTQRIPSHAVLVYSVNL